MRDLLEAIREEATPVTWQRGVRLAGNGTIQGRRTEEGDLEVRIATAGGMLSPLVVLSTAHEDWSCECPSDEGACQHVVGAAVAIERAEREGRDLFGLKGPGARVHYAFTEEAGRLSLTRLLDREGVRTPLSDRLATAQRKPHLQDVETNRADLEVDVLLGPEKAGPLPAPYVPKVLALLKGSEQVSLDDQVIEVGPAQHTVAAVVRDRPDGFEIVAAPKRFEKRFANGGVVADGALCPEADPLSDRDLDALSKGKHYTFDQVADLVGRVIPALQERLPVQQKSKVLPKAQSMKPRISLGSESVDGQVRVLATLVYGDPPSARVDAGRMTYLGGALPLRDSAAEARLVRELKYASGLEVGRPQVLDPREAVSLSARVNELGNVHFSGAGLDAFRTHGALEATLDFDEGSFDVRFTTADGQQTDADAVLSAWRAHSSLVSLRDGGFAELPADWLSKYGHMLTDLLAARESQAAAQGAKRSISAGEALEIARLCEALDHPLPATLGGLRQLLSQERAESLAQSEVVLPADLNAELRDYQLEGVRFLQSLRKAGLGALLADDMGLGKTLQALCVLEGPALVVCPASVLFNWRAELEKFRPNLRVRTYHGGSRSLDPEADVTLTTYAILRLDREALSEIHFSTVVLDEAQTIKNPQSKVAQAAYALDAGFRVALTGTPVENRLEDLWSQMHFLNRGLLGGRRDFQERYAQPMAEGDRGAGERLRRRIKPLLLRRLKSQVAAELPPRTEIILRCDLDETERALYQGVQAAAREQIVQELDSGGSVLAALEALLRLRQACCHPALLPGQKAEDSSKLKLLRETLEEVVSEGHKALVFSQWTRLLDLTEPGLDAMGLRYVRLDGSTRDRGAVVDKFQNDPDVPVMLLSLKAGGVGLNLTAADHVFLLDPWWNPAVEDQAADRAHRIGQERPVFVHRLVAESSVEERIVALQERKRALAEAATEGASALSLSRADLLGLLE